MTQRITERITERVTESRINIGRVTDVGNVREINEDTVLAETLLGSAANAAGLTAVLLVADGMGGHQAGEVASGIAAEMTRQAFLSATAFTLLPGGSRTDAKPAYVETVHTDPLPVEDLAERAIALVRQINHAVYALGGPGAGHPGTTCTLCLCQQSRYTIAHVGDSRAYLLTRGGICQITEDDSWVGEAVRRGTLTPEEARTSHLRNQLTRAVGISAELSPSLYQGTWRPGDVLLLCSDGLSEYVLPEEVRATLACTPDLQTACETLVALARERGGHDNISLVAACDGHPQQVQRKPPTWNGEVNLHRIDETVPTPAGRPPPAIQPALNPDRLLRPLLLCLVLLALLIFGLAVVRRQRTASTRTTPTTQQSMAK